MGSWDLPFQISRNHEVGITDNVNIVIGVDFLALCRILCLVPRELIIALLAEWGHSAVTQGAEEHAGLQWSNLGALGEGGRTLPLIPLREILVEVQIQCKRTLRINNLLGFYMERRKNLFYQRVIVLSVITSHLHPKFNKILIITFAFN